MKVAILLFNDVEVLDFSGPFEVFSLAKHLGSEDNIFDVVTVSQKGETVVAKNGLKIIPDYHFNNMPKPDILIVPGGYGAREREIYNPIMIDKIKELSRECGIVASVCTGALLLATADLLDGKRATTHYASLDRLENEFPRVKVIRGVKYVDEGEIVTSGGISAGIDMSFHLLKRLVGVEVARETAKRMEYDIQIN